MDININMTFDGRSFTADHTQGLRHLAVQHAERAEELLRTISCATYGSTPVTATVAAVHAQLAVAYAAAAQG